MRLHFPFLDNPASPEYIQALENAETSWIKTKKDLYDPILSIRVEQLTDVDWYDDLSSSDDSDMNQ